VTSDEARVVLYLRRVAVELREVAREDEDTSEELIQMSEMGARTLEAAALAISKGEHKQ
jgi:N-acyl-D-aspartate/D-glutamate deacylase